LHLRAINVEPLCDNLAERPDRWNDRHGLSMGRQAEDRAWRPFLLCRPV
jgi:hypothetical protein